MSCVFTNRPHLRLWVHARYTVYGANPWTEGFKRRRGGAKVSRYWNRIPESFPPSVSNASVDIYCASMNRRGNKNRDPAISALVTLIMSWIASALGCSPRALWRERIRLVFHERNKATIRHIKKHKKYRAGAQIASHLKEVERELVLPVLCVPNVALPESNQM